MVVVRWPCEADHNRSQLGLPSVLGLSNLSSLGPPGYLHTDIQHLQAASWIRYLTTAYQNNPYVSGISPSAKDLQDYLLTSGLTIPACGSSFGRDLSGSDILPVTFAAAAPPAISSPLEVRGDDRLSLGNGMYLIVGENTFFLELENNGLDMPIDSMSILQISISLTVAIPHLLLALRKIGSNLAAAALRSIPHLASAAGIAPTTGSLCPLAISGPAIGQPVFFNAGLGVSTSIHAPQTSTHLVPNPLQLPAVSNGLGRSNLLEIGANPLTSQQAILSPGKFDCSYFNASNSGIEIPWGWNF